MHRAKDKRLDSMPTCNLVVRVRAGQMNRPASGLTILCAGPTASIPFEPAHAGGERPCPEMSVAPAVQRQLSVLVKGITER